MKESTFQSKLIHRIKRDLVDCVVMKTDSSYLQGFPDLLILYNERWGALECKKQNSSRRQPNQDYYVKKLNKMSFCAFIDPCNEEKILYGLYKALTSKRYARTS